MESRNFQLLNHFIFLFALYISVIFNQSNKKGEQITIFRFFRAVLIEVGILI